MAGSSLGALRPLGLSQVHGRHCCYYHPVCGSLAGLSFTPGPSAKNLEGSWENDFPPGTGAGSPEELLSWN